MDIHNNLSSSARALASASSDYDRVRRAIEFISTRHRSQPSIEAIAQAVGLSPSHLHELFKRWAGLTPKAFLQAVTLDRARRLLRQEASLLEASLELGLSGPSRLHDLFVAHEAMTPGAYKARGEGLHLRYGYHDTPFGLALAVAAPLGLAGLGFVENEDRPSALADMQARWPKAQLSPDQAVTAPLVARAFDQRLWRAEAPLRVVLIGADFEIRVWTALLRVPFGSATSYGELARRIGRPNAARAVGAAVGRNPISFVVPCHRVLGANGALTGYRWGLTRKCAILGWEAGAAGGVEAAN